jgi:UDP-glucose 4-epimerase
MAKCLVLGADGFIGSHLTEALAKAGHEVRAFGRFADGKARNLKPDQPAVTWFAGDFLVHADLERAIKGMDYVFHLVSTTTPASSGKSPLLDIDTNLHMSVEMMALCQKHGVKRVIFASTGGAIYGRALSRPTSEDDRTEPVSPYGIGKLAIEGYLRYFQHAQGLDYLSLRISNPYGERQNLTGSQGVIPIFLNLIRQAQPLGVYGDGSMVRDYIYICDLVDMVVDMFDKPTKHRTYNLGSGTGVALNNLIEGMRKITGAQVVVDHKPERPTDLKYVVLDVKRYREEFGMPKLLGLDEGLARTWRYVQEAAK